MDSIEKIIHQFDINSQGIDLHNLKAPWYKINGFINETDYYSNEFDEFFQAVDAIDNFNDIASDEVRI